MGFLSSLNIAGSGLTAQKQRLDVISENITNQDTTRTENGGAYRRKMVVFQAQGENFRSYLERIRSSAPNYVGTKFNRDASLNKLAQQPGVKVIEVIEDETSLIPRYDPTHPDANEEGYVMMPNVNNTKEMIDMMEANRAYDANITVFNAIKAMAMKSLEIGK